MTFGEKFKLTLERRDFSQKQFALKMNVSESAISDYVNNRSQPNILLAKEFAKELDVSIDYLLDYVPKSEKVALSPDETAMLNAFRSLTNEQQKIMKSLIEMLSQK